jgi:hypothetical protein
MACASSPARRGVDKKTAASRRSRRGGVRRSRLHRRSVNKLSAKPAGCLITQSCTLSHSFAWSSTCRQDANTSTQHGLMLALDSVCLCARWVCPFTAYTRVLIQHQHVLIHQSNGICNTGFLLCMLPLGDWRCFLSRVKDSLGCSFWRH